MSFTQKKQEVAVEFDKKAEYLKQLKAEITQIEKDMIALQGKYQAYEELEKEAQAGRS
jgi:predicted  nucleic acid-binding Zn-ribbon protein